MSNMKNSLIANPMKQMLPAILISILTGCTFMGVDGQHNAWKEFHDRCVRQIASGQPVSTVGLEQGSIKNIAQGLRDRQNPTDTYWLPKNSLWTLQTNAEQSSCTVYVKSRGIQAYSLASSWLEKAYENGMFVPSHHSSDRGELLFENGNIAYIYISLEDHNEFMKDAYLMVHALDERLTFSHLPP